MPNRNRKPPPSRRESRKQDPRIGRPWTCTNPHCLHRNCRTNLECSKCNEPHPAVPRAGRPSRRCRVTLRSRSRRAHRREASRRRDPGQRSPKPEPQTASSGPRCRDHSSCSPKAEPQMASSGHQSPKGYPAIAAAVAAVRAAAGSPSSPTEMPEVPSSLYSTSELEDCDSACSRSRSLSAVPAAGASVAVPAAGGHTQPAPVAAREAPSHTATASFQQGGSLSHQLLTARFAQLKSLKRGKERTEVAHRLEKARVERRLGEARAASEKAAVKWREAAEAQRAAFWAWAKVEELGEAACWAWAKDPLVAQQLEAVRNTKKTKELLARTEQVISTMSGAPLMSEGATQGQRRGRSPGPHPPSELPVQPARQRSQSPRQPMRGVAPAEVTAAVNTRVQRVLAAGSAGKAGVSAPRGKCRHMHCT